LLRYIRQVSFEVKVFQTADVADSSYCPAISLKKPLLPNLIAAQKSTGFQLRVIKRWPFQGAN